MHSSSVVSTVTSCQEGHGFDSRWGQGLSVWSLHVLPMLVWVYLQWVSLTEGLAKIWRRSLGDVLCLPPAPQGWVKCRAVCTSKIPLTWEKLCKVKSQKPPQLKPWLPTDGFDSKLLELSRNNVWKSAHCQTRREDNASVPQWSTVWGDIDAHKAFFVLCYHLQGRCW